MVGHSLQDINCISLHNYWKKQDMEVLIEISSGLDREHASVYFLLKEVFRPLCGLVSFKKH